MAITMKTVNVLTDAWTAEQYRLMYPALMDSWNAMNDAIEEVESSNKLAIWVSKLYDTKFYHIHKELLDKANMLAKEYNILYKLLYDPSIRILPEPPRGTRSTGPR